MGDETYTGTGAGDAVGPELEEELSIEADAFRLDRIFATMAHIDFDRTRVAAQSLAGEIPRSYANVAAARAALEKR
jgi:hypothetical protein